jgi:Tol biopolymer transport system component
MSDDVRFERLLAEVLSDLAPTRAPDRLVPDILTAASRTRRRPRWLALAIERPMRRRAEVLVGSPTLRLAYVLVLALLVALSAVAALVAGGVIPRTPDRVVMIPQPTRFAPPNSPLPSQPSRPVRNGLIAVVSDGDLVLIDPTTGRTVKTLRPADSETDVVDLSWAPDGRSLAFAGAGGVWVMDMSTTTAEKIVDCGVEADACSIAWSPDGGRIALAVDGRVHLIDPDGGNWTTIIERPGLSGPIWSPDGRRIAFQVPANIGEGRPLMAVNRDGSGLEQLLGPAPGIGVGHPAWAPDGSSIAYIRSTDHQTCPGPSRAGCQDDWQLHVMIAELGNPEPHELLAAGICFCLGFSPGLTWSPDGTALALVIPGEDNDGVFAGLVVVNADGTGLRQLAPGWGSPAWQPIP